MSSSDARASGVMNCAAYSGGVRTEEVSVDDIREVLRRGDRFVWLGLYEPDEDLLRRVQQQFHLHDLAIEDAYNAHQLSSWAIPRAWCSARRTFSSGRTTS
jgi:Mg2+ and Co2+ transporter CorA